MRRTWARTLPVLAAVTAVVVAVALLLTWMHRSRPRAGVDLTVEVPAGLRASPGQVVTCERLTPGTPPAGTVEQAPAPGRVTSRQLVECPDLFDGRPVTYVGEVVGDVLRREGGAYVLVNDDGYALGQGPLPAAGEPSGGNSGVAVWLDGELADLVSRPGGPGVRGEVLAIQGVVHRTDPHDGGGLTIRARQARVLAPAREVPSPVHPGHVAVAIGLAALAVGATVAERVIARRR